MSNGPQYIILKEGSSESKGRDAQRNNMQAAKLIAELVKTSLGPRGMDKMLVDSLGDVTITNDGATMLKEIDVQHPAAKMMVEISKATDNEVGDGTTSGVILAGSLLEKAEELINQDVHPTVVVDGYMKALEKGFDHALLNRRNEFLGDVAARDFVFELKARAGIRLDAQLHACVLAAAAGLLLMRVIELRNLPDGLVIRHLRLADVRARAEFALHAVDNDFEMQLSHPGQNGLPGIRIG